MRTITVDNAGPIEKLEISLPEDGGIVCLKAAHGRGKSIALNAVKRQLGADVKIPVRDGEEKAEVSGVGVRMVVGKKSGKYGQLEVESLEGKFDLGDLLEPGVQDPKAADSKRIKSLISISGIKADKALFQSLFSSEEEFRNVVQVTSVEGDDLVEMAARVKRDIEQAARASEICSVNKLAEANGLQGTVPQEMVEMELPPLESLEQELREAQDEAAAIRERRKYAIHVHEKSKQISAELGQLSVHDLAEIVDRGQKHAESVKAIENAIRVLESELNTMRSSLISETSKRDAAREEYLKAKYDADRSNELRQQLAMAMPAIPDDEAISSADAHVQAVVRQIDAVKQKDSIQQVMEKIQTALGESENAKCLGERYRKMAGMIDGLLSNVVSASGGSLRVDNGRLVLNTDRGVEKFSDLSDGEKAKIGIDFQIACSGQNGLLVLKQNVFEGLNASTRQQIAEHAKQRKVTILTAECSEDDKIQVEQLS